jgi:hypothetical protein
MSTILTWSVAHLSDNVKKFRKRSKTIFFATQVKCHPVAARGGRVGSNCPRVPETLAPPLVPSQTGQNNIYRTTGNLDYIDQTLTD